MELIWDFAFKSISEETKTLLRIFCIYWPVSVLNRWLFPKAFQLWTETYTSSLKTRAHNRLKRDTLRRWQDKTITLKPNHSGNNSLKALRFRFSLSKQCEIKMSKSSWKPLCGLQVRFFQLYQTIYRKIPHSCFKDMTQSQKYEQTQKQVHKNKGSYSVFLSSHEPIIQVSEHKSFHTSLMIPSLHYGGLFFNFILNLSVQWFFFPLYLQSPYLIHYTSFYWHR